MTSQTNGQFDRTPLIAGNWKMNMDHAQAITLLQKLAWTLDDAKHDYSRAEVAVFPPFTDIRSVQTLIDADKIPFALGAQDLSAHDSGAYTGEVSGAFLSKLDAKYVIIGHSERRRDAGETDQLIGHKLGRAVGAGQGRPRPGGRGAAAHETVDRERRVVYLHAIGMRDMAAVEGQRRRVQRWEERIVKAVGSRAQLRTIRDGGGPVADLIDAGGAS